jgi:thioredoxin 1
MRLRATIRGAVLGAILGWAVFLVLKPWKPSAVLVSNPVVAALFGGLLGGMTACAARSYSVTFQPSRRVTEITSAEELERFLESRPVILMSFHAEWCALCHTLKPTLHGLADAYGDRIAVGSVNIEDVLIPARLHVTGIPDVRVFRRGEECDHVTGVQPRGRYVEALEKALSEGGTDTKNTTKEDA